MTALALTRPRVNDPYADAPMDVLFEVVNGVRVEKNLSAWEQHLAGVLYSWLAPYCRTHDLGHAEIETMFALPNSTNDRKPDVSFVSFTRWPKTRAVPRVNAWPIAPDLAVEVISPTDTMNDVIAKVHEYFESSVRLVWLILPSLECVYVYTSTTQLTILTRSDTLTGGDVVPGFTLAMSELFPETTNDDSAPCTQN